MIKIAVMRVYFIIVFLLLIFIKVKSQTFANRIGINDTDKDKPLIDTSVYSKWPAIKGAGITNDGLYMYYMVKNGVLNDYTTVLKKCVGIWEVKIPHVTGVQFTANSKRALWSYLDTLFIIQLGGPILEKIPMAGSVMVPTKGDGDWLAFRHMLTNDLVLKNLKTGVRKSFSFIKNFRFSEDGKFLVLEKEESKDSKKQQSLVVVELANNRMTTLWHGTGWVKMIMNSTASQFVFLRLGDHSEDKQIWYCERDGARPQLLVANSLISNDTSFVLNDLDKLSDNGRYISFSIKKVESSSLMEVNDKNANINIWSYLDEKLQPTQLMEANSNPIYEAIVDIVDHKITRLIYDNEQIMDKSRDDNVYLIQHLSGKAEGMDWTWNTQGQLSFYIRSISTHSNILLEKNTLTGGSLSPDGRFLVFFDKECNCYFSYQISSGVYRNITKDANVSWIDYNREDLLRSPRGVAAWLDDNDAVLIYDKFDIWLIDLTGRRKPINITNGYGLKHSIIFNLALYSSQRPIVSVSDVIILNAFDLRNKQNGYFRTKITSRNDPESLTIGSYLYHLENNPYVKNGGAFPIKARDSNAFIVMRMKANESPNYFFTSDFRTFFPMSDVYPEKAYNWYTTELHTWKKSDGRLIHGILYKPDNFDSNKRYPLIFYYYEKMSFSLNEYILPENISSGCTINIPTFVSNGYLVFAPDIEYCIGDPMQGAYDAIVSAAHYLSTIPYVDSSRMGIGGCSFGGIQTNYLITKTNIFAAAYSASAISDWISAYGDVPLLNRGLQTYFEWGQGRMGGTLWQMPDIYIKNSAVLGADKIMTPLLLMHGRNDPACSFSQAVELFTALRRLGKKAWLLEYTNGGHGIYGRNAEDFGIRLRQFFDHYLKGKPAPVWMTRGVPAKLKGIENGFKLDRDIKTPGKGLLMQSERESDDR